MPNLSSSVVLPSSFLEGQDLEGLEGQDLEDLILSWVFLFIFGLSCIVGSASLFREGVPKLRRIEPPGR